MPIFSDDLLNQLAIDAEQQINQDLQCIYTRFCLATVIGQSVYTLPSYVRGVKRVAWRGKKLDPVTFDDMMLLTPATAGGFLDNTTIGRPLYYCMHPTNPYDIRLFPTPDEAFTDNAEDPFSPSVNGASCIVACWRSTDDIFADPRALLPAYIDRRTRKAFILWKAFENEGKGQNLTASAYYQQKYEFLIQQFMQINDGAYISKRYAVDDGALTIDGFRMPKPFLPTNYEREIFR